MYLRRRTVCRAMGMINPVADIASTNRIYKEMRDSSIRRATKQLAHLQAGPRVLAEIMIGSAPVTPAFADETGAGAYAPDAASAVDIARTLAG